MYQIRFHGRGGQGAVTAAEILAVAAGFEGKHSQSFPFFGVERRGAPVTSFCRIDTKPIRVHQQIYNPDFVVILDPSLMKADVCSGVNNSGVVVANTNSPKSEVCNYFGPRKVYIVDATQIALKDIGRPIVNTAMLGAFAKASGAVELESLKKAVLERFKQPIADKNVKALEDCYNNLQ